MRVTPRVMPRFVQRACSACAAQNEGEELVRRSAAPEVSSTAPRIQRRCAACSKEEGETPLQAKPVGGALPAKAPGDLVARLGSGRERDQRLRAFMEPRFGHDFTDVRIHDGPGADAAARSVRAVAFTVNNDIVFRAGAYAPTSHAGQKLLAHELAHTVQQGVGRRHAGEAVPLSRTAQGRVQRQAFFFEGPIELPPEVGRIGTTPLPEAVPLPESIPLPEGAPVPDPVPAPEGAPVPDPVPAPEGAPLPEPVPEPAPMPEPFVGPLPTPKPDTDEKPDKKCGSPELPPSVVSFSPGPLGQGGTATAMPLTRCPGKTHGSFPSTRIYADQFACISAANQSSLWLRAHLLHGKTKRSPVRNLHGPGNDMQNLIIADNTLNQRMLSGAEAPAITRVHGNNEVLWYESKVDAYVPGLEFFAQSMTVNFGSFDPITHTKGPRLGGGTFTLGHTPPNCPALASTGPGVVPEVAAPAAQPSSAQFSFQSTLQICLRELASRQFAVPDGGLEVQIATHWANSGGEPQDTPTCPVKTFKVTLVQHGWLGESDVNTIEVPVGGLFSLHWKQLVSGNYHLRFESMNTNPDCCLTGDVSALMFSAPRRSPSFGAPPQDA